MKSYRGGAGEGGSNILEQATEQTERIGRALSKVKHRVAVASGKGGVGKSTVTRTLAAALAARGFKVAIVDADVNGPAQARMTGLSGAAPAAGVDGWVLPKSRDGVGVVSVSAFPPESSTLGEVLASVVWGKLDVLLFDLPHGAERTLPFAGLPGAPTSFILVTIPSELSRGAVAQTASALEESGSPVLGYVENMSGYACPDCGGIKPLFPETKDGIVLDLPCLGRVPFDPSLAFACDRGVAIIDLPESAATRALSAIAGRLVESLESAR
jgi:ATP-binding protein involved in chromosome partitioning